MKHIDPKLEIFRLKLESLIMFLTSKVLIEESTKWNKGILKKTQSEKEMTCKFGLQFIRAFDEMFFKEPSVSWREICDKGVRL